jgi:plastocyanin
LSTRSSSPRWALVVSIVLGLLSMGVIASADDLPSPAAVPESTSESDACLAAPMSADAPASPGADASGSSPAPEGGVSLPSFGTEACPASLPPQGSPAPSASADAQAVTVRSGEFWFDPREVVVRAAGPTTLVLTNTGISVHNLTIDELGIQVVASRGRSGEATIEDPPPGTYEFYCSISGHRQAGMVGTLIVE